LYPVPYKGNQRFLRIWHARRRDLAIGQPSSSRSSVDDLLGSHAGGDLRESYGYWKLAQLEVADAIIFSVSRTVTGSFDRSGLELKNDDAAIAKAKVLAIGVSLDKAAVDPERHIAVLNGSREQSFSVPVYFKPSMSNG
jgi:hypothetical protein